MFFVLFFLSSFGFANAQCNFNLEGCQLESERINLNSIEKSNGSHWFLLQATSNKLVLELENAPSNIEVVIGKTYDGAPCNMENMTPLPIRFRSKQPYFVVVVHDLVPGNFYKIIISNVDNNTTLFAKHEKPTDEFNPGFHAQKNFTKPTNAEGVQILKPVRKQKNNRIQDSNRVAENNFSAESTSKPVAYKPTKPELELQITRLKSKIRAIEEDPNKDQTTLSKMKFALKNWEQQLQELN